MKIKWDNEKLSPRSIARRIIDGALESAHFWQDRLSDYDEKDRPTQKQIDAISQQVSSIAESIRKRHKISHDAGCEKV